MPRFGGQLHGLAAKVASELDMLPLVLDQAASILTGLIALPTWKRWLLPVFLFYVLQKNFSRILTVGRAKITVGTAIRAGFGFLPGIILGSAMAACMGKEVKFRKAHLSTMFATSLTFYATMLVEYMAP